MISIISAAQFIKWKGNVLVSHIITNKASILSRPTPGSVVCTLTEAHPPSYLIVYIKFLAPYCLQ